jgi:hypothetical protein
MLAYISWHTPAPAAERTAYEEALVRFHRSLAHQPPSGFHGSTSARVEGLPWCTGPVYEDWHSIEDWAALGVLEEAAVSRGHASSHDAVAALSGAETTAVYRLLEGAAAPRSARVAVWIAPAHGHPRTALGALLGDGIDPRRDGLWERCLGLGPATRYCLLAREAPAGVAPSRLPAGWSAHTLEREVVWGG